MVNSYNYYKVERLKAERYYNHKTLSILAKIGQLQYCTAFSQTFMLTGSHKFLSAGGTVLTAVLPRTNVFFSVIS